MRIVQIIDSLEAGGAEKMAVNYANALAENIEFSGLIATRQEGPLLKQINKNVSYLFLEKKRKIDFPAVFRLRKYLKKNNVNLIHAHSSSFFTAVLVRFFFKIKIIWHDHYGISQNLKQRKNLGLKVGSFWFDGIISVNTALKDWAFSYLWCSKIKYLPNFIKDNNIPFEKIELKGNEKKRIVCVANLRPQKNHILLISAAKRIKESFPDWSFHLFGKDFKDSYSEQLFQEISLFELKKTVFFYGTIDNVIEVLKECDIAVLPSLSEGLPLSVLEYGLCKLPVIAANVGEIEKVITSKNTGILIESNNLEQFTEALEKLIKEKELRQTMGQNLNKFIESNYSEKAVIKDYILWLNKLFIFSANSK